jgi:CheY-like chemotaxis protein
MGRKMEEPDFAPTIAIVDDEKLIAEAFSYRLNDLGYRTIIPQKVLDLDAIRGVHAVLMDINLGEDQNGIDYSREIKERYGIPVIFISAFLQAFSGKLFELSQEGNLDGVINKRDTELTKLEIILNRLKKTGKIGGEICTGLVGLGNTGMHTVDLLGMNPLVKIGVWSKTRARDYSFVKNSLGLRFSEEVVFYEEKKEFAGLERLVKTNPETMIITSGARFNPKRSRTEEFNEAVLRVDPILEKIGEMGYRGLVLIVTNPVASFVELANRYGLNAVGLSPDSHRNRLAIASKYSVNKDQVDSIDSIVIGNHGLPVSLLSSTKINGVELKYNSRFEEKLHKILKRWGRDVMIGSLSTGRHVELGDVISDFLNSMTHFEKYPLHSCTIYHPDIKNYTQWPVEIVYPHLEIKPREIPELNESEEKRFKKSMGISDVEHSLVEGYLKQKSI